MSKRKYYVHHYRDFYNTYHLWYVEPGTPFEVPPAWRQIARKEAIALAREETRRRKYESSSAGYADEAIYPVMVKRTRPDGTEQWIDSAQVYRWTICDRIAETE